MLNNQIYLKFYFCFFVLSSRMFKNTCKLCLKIPTCLPQSLPKLLTGVHLCSCKSPNLPAPDNQITNTDDRAICQTCVTRWLGRGGVGITYIFNIHVRLTKPATNKGPNKMFFSSSKTELYLCPIKTNLEAPKGVPSQNKNKS